MSRSYIAALVLALSGLVAACGGGGGGSPSVPGGGGGGGGGSTPPPPVAAMTIGFSLPSGLIGTIATNFGEIGGYTQSVYSQVDAFPPGTTITLKNLSTTTQHTLNVLSTTAFPASPSLSTSASGGSTLAMGFATGALNPGATMSVTLANPGTYYIGCAFHYPTSPSMRGIIEVSSSATPGPQATPPSSGNGGGNGGGY